MLIQWIHWERERGRKIEREGEWKEHIARMKNSISNFHFGWNDLFKNVVEAMKQFRLVLPATILLCDLKFVCVSVFLEWTKKFLHMKMFIHLVWHAMCAAFHWIELNHWGVCTSIFKEHQNQQTYFIQGTKMLLSRIVKYVHRHIYTAHRLFYAPSIQWGFHTLHDSPLKLNTMRKERLRLISFGCCCCSWWWWWWFFSICAVNTWPVSHHFSLIARPNNIIVFFEIESAQKLFSNFMR